MIELYVGFWVNPNRIETVEFRSDQTLEVQLIGWGEPIVSHAHPETGEPWGMDEARKFIKAAKG